jgi:hypothetical protein
MLSPISLIYLSFDAPCHSDARGMVCFWRRAQITEKVGSYRPPRQQPCNSSSRGQMWQASLRCWLQGPSANVRDGCRVLYPFLLLLIVPGHRHRKHRCWLLGSWHGSQAWHRLASHRASHRTAWHPGSWHRIGGTVYLESIECGLAKLDHLIVL